MRKAVFSFFTIHTSGVFPGWDNRAIATGKYLREKNIDHISFYRDYSENSQFPANERHKISHDEMKNIFTIKKKIGTLIKKYDKIIFHQHAQLFPCGLWVFNNMFNKKFHWILTDHDSWYEIDFSTLKKAIRVLARNFGFLPEIILGCSEASKRRLQQLYGRKNIDFIYNGAEIPDIPAPKRLLSKPTKALFVGRLEKYKGVWPLVKAVEIMRKKKIDISLTVVGDGSISDQLREYINKNNLNNFINLAGYSYNVAKFYSKNHFILIPSIYEDNCPMVSLESQAYYLPCIYTNSGGLPETQINQKTGIMVPKNSPEKIVEAIQFFQNDINSFNQMRLAARENSLKFNIDKMAKNYVNLYLGLLEQ